MMNMQVFIFKYMPFLIIGTVVLTFILLMTTLIMCLSLGHLSYKNIFPTVSLTGAYNPEHIVYETGFTVISLLMLFIAYVIHRKLIHPLLVKAGETLHRRRLNVAAYVLCVIGLVGLVLQSYMPCKKEEKVHYRTHMASAMVFFVASGTYILCTTITIFPLGFFRYTLFFKVCTNVMYFVGGVAYVFGYTIKKKSDASRLERALSEWVAVFGYIAYFSSFSVDLLKARSVVLQNAHNDNNTNESGKEEESIH